MKRRLNKGVSWQMLCDEITPNSKSSLCLVWYWWLSPDLCPGTGTPVPGGLSFDQALTLFATLADHKKRIIGFDLCEVAEPEIAQDDLER